MARLYRIAKNLAGETRLLPAFAATHQSIRVNLKAQETRTPVHKQSDVETTPTKPLSHSSDYAFLGSSTRLHSAHHRKRIKTTYTDNYSAALSLPYSWRELQKEHENDQATLNLSKQLIVEHASRRVDLFFYTMIAYYNTGFHPILGHTDLQHGRGRSLDRFTNLTEACHSSLTPSLLDEFSDGTNRKRYSGSILTGTHFMESLNTTVELPHFVNELDDLLEEYCRGKSIKILNQVALGQVDPIAGFTNFLQMMQDSLTELKKRGELQRKNTGVRFFDPPKHPIRLDVLELIHKGSLGKTYSQDSKVASDDYVQLMLRLTPTEIEQCHKTKEMKAKIYAEKILVIQKEILESKSAFEPMKFSAQMRGM
ncbi:hypothetical protein [Legionella waltersii]|uniref:Uncharacterized protein n=1 Tax=Legionella waltersii TaxID=66969 RepID=A0A0W1ADM7_9GAMM|nr:hypothetical protein [Legionella waltersii]KTD79441.1 hypothetical protein Lwal_1513 [Legionella waltersii]SNU97634.1 Uncharacterised protein [Legionella waltersii]